MDKEYLTQITNDLYRLTLLFPKKEPLRYKMRELADNIVTNLVLIIEGNVGKYQEFIDEIKKNIEPLDVFFEIAKNQNWVNSDDVLNIQEKFLVIKEELAQFEQQLRGREKSFKKEKTEREPVISLASFNSRQKKIVDILKRKEKVQVQDVQDVFPEITKRTLRRDFDSLLKAEIIKRSGKANLTFYHLANRDI